MNQSGRRDSAYASASDLSDLDKRARERRGSGQMTSCAHALEVELKTTFGSSPHSSPSFSKGRVYPLRKGGESARPSERLNEGEREAALAHTLRTGVTQLNRVELMTFALTSRDNGTFSPFGIGAGLIQGSFIVQHGEKGES